jgi:TRAP-type uncharacterized transport system fused permease subunit
LSETFKQYGQMMIPLAALIYFLTIKKYNPIYAAWLGILIAGAISFLKQDTRLTVKRFARALETGVKGVLPVAIACACAGIVIGIISLTGFGLVFSMNIFKLSFGILFLGLFFTMVALIIWGWGLPTTPATSSPLHAGTALVNMGVVPWGPLLRFLLSIMSTITPRSPCPPLSRPAAKSDPVKTGVTGFRLAIAGLLSPSCWSTNRSC